MLVILILKKFLIVYNMNGYSPLMKNIFTPSELLKKYIKRASQI